MANDIGNFSDRWRNIIHSAQADSEDESEILYLFDEETKIGTCEKHAKDNENNAKIKFTAFIRLDAGQLDYKPCIAYKRKSFRTSHEAS